MRPEGGEAETSQPTPEGEEHEAVGREVPSRQCYHPIGQHSAVPSSAQQGKGHRGYALWESEPWWAVNQGASVLTLALPTDKLRFRSSLNDTRMGGREERFCLVKLKGEKGHGTS